MTISKTTKLLFLLVSILSIATQSIAREECDVSREEIVLDTGVYFDSNNDNLLGEDELQEAWDSLLTSKEKTMVTFAPWVEKVSVIMEHCDKDRDGYVSITDFINSPDTCLNSCAKLHLMKDKILKRKIDQLPADSHEYYERRRHKKQKIINRIKQRLGIKQI